MAPFVNSIFSSLIGYHRELDNIIKGFDTLEEGLDQYYQQMRDLKNMVGPHKADIADSMMRNQGVELPPQAVDWKKALQGSFPLLDLLETQIKVIPAGLSTINKAAEDALGRVGIFRGLIPTLQREGNEDEVEDAKAMLGLEFRRRQQKIRERGEEIEGRFNLLKTNIGEVRDELKGLLGWLGS